MDKTATQLFRDLMRLAEHVGGRGVRGDKIKTMVRAEFRKHSGEKDPEKVEQLLGTARSALTNYLVMDNLAREGKLPKVSFEPPVGSARGGARGASRSAAGAGRPVAPSAAMASRPAAPGGDVPKRSASSAARRRRRRLPVWRGTARK